MVLKDLRGKELSNLYALFKQSNSFFDGSEISFLTDKSQLMLTYYVKLSCTLEEKTSKALKAIDVNPGNTKDSIAEEMIENLKEILKLHGNDGSKEMGYLMSLNRLMSYQITSLENLTFFNNEEQEVMEIIDHLEEFRTLQKSIF